MKHNFRQLVADIVNENDFIIIRNYLLSKFIEFRIDAMLLLLPNNTNIHDFPSDALSHFRYQKNKMILTNNDFYIGSLLIYGEPIQNLSKEEFFNKINALEDKNEFYNKIKRNCFYNKRIENSPDYRLNYDYLHLTESAFNKYKKLFNNLYSLYKNLDIHKIEIFNPLNFLENIIESYKIIFRSFSEEKGKFFTSVEEFLLNNEENFIQVELFNIFPTIDIIGFKEMTHKQQENDYYELSHILKKAYYLWIGEESIERYKDTMLELGKIKLNNKLEDVNQIVKQFRINEHFPKQKSNSIINKKEQINPLQKCPSESQIISDLSRIKGFKILTTYGKTKFVEEYTKDYNYYSKTYTQDHFDILHDLYDGAHYTLIKIYEYLIFFKILHSSWDLLTINFHDPATLYEKKINLIIDSITKLSKEMKPILKGKLESEEYQIYGYDESSLFEFFKSIGLENVKSIPTILDIGPDRYNHFDKTISDFLLFMNNSVFDIQLIINNYNIESPYSKDLIQLINETNTFYEYSDYYKEDIPELKKNSINIFLLFYKLMDNDYNKKYNNIIKTILQYNNITQSQQLKRTKIFKELFESGYHKELASTIKPKPIIPKEPYLFKNEGDSWLIRFKGNEKHVACLKGMEYINVCLHRPRILINYEILANKNEISEFENSIATTDISFVYRDLQHLRTEYDRISTPEFKGSTIDAEAEIEMEKIDVAIRQKENEINRYYNKTPFENNNTLKNKAKRNVQKNIRTAKNRIKIIFPDFYQHLNSYLKIHNGVLYESDIEWN
jgi:hypothetical protein